MSYIFISHSSENNFEAIALHDWLLEQGWNELFLDIDPERGIAAGERWERALHEAAHRCEAVLFLVSEAWLASNWCRREFRLAQRLNKRILGALIEDLATSDLPRELTDTWQLVKLAAGADHEIHRAVHPHTGDERHVHFSRAGLTRLRTGLVKAGLDPKFFEWPPADDARRPPYRGMKPLEAEDAGIFFGREAPTIDLLAQLRGLKEAPAPRLLVILGASGAGKSSFLRAGILPRLSRDERHFIPLPVLRPENSALWGDTGLLQVLAQAFNDAGMKVTRGAIRDALEAESDHEKTGGVLRGWLQELVSLRALTPLPGETYVTPSLVLPIDQGEELFVSEGREEAQACLNILRQLCDQAELPLIVIFTIRSDSYDYLQTSRALEGLPQNTFSLMPMPSGAYHNVIEGPALRLANSERALVIEPALTERLMQDIDEGGSRDALPLLAFTMERLYLEYGSDGDLTLDEYQIMGGIEGAISAAAEEVFRKAQADPALPSQRSAQEALLRRSLVPWLAGIDPDTQAPRRRVAKLREIPAEAQPVIQHMVEQRLLSTDVNLQGETTVEPAHEALLRQWGLLKGWLEEDFAALSILEALQRATRDWLANDRADGWLNHNAGRLEDAERLNQRDDLGSFMNTDDRAYLAASREAENERREQALREAQRLAQAREKEAEAQKRVAARTRLGLAVASALTVIAVILGLQALDQQNKAQQSQADLLLNSSIELAASDQGKQSVVALLQALELEPDNRAAIARLTSLLTQRTFPVMKSEIRLFDGEIRRAFKSPDGGLLVTLSTRDEISIFDIASGAPWNVRQQTGNVTDVAFSADNHWLALLTQRGQIQLWDREQRQIKQRLADGSSSGGLAISEDGRYVAGQNVWDLNDSPRARLALPEFEGLVSLHWDERQPGVTSVLRNGLIEHWPLTDNNLPLASRRSEQPGGISQSLLSPDGQFLVTASDDAWVYIWDFRIGELINSFQLNSQVSVLLMTEDILYCATLSGALYEWDVEKQSLTSERSIHDGSVSDLDFHAGTLLSASWDGSARLHAASLPSSEPIRHTTTVFSALPGMRHGEVYTATTDGILRKWRYGRPGFLFETLHSMADISQIAHDATFRQVATVAGENRKLFLEDLASHRRRVFDSEAPILHVSIHPGGNQMRWITAAGELHAAEFDAGEWRGREPVQLDHRPIRVLSTDSWDAAILQLGRSEFQLWNIDQGFPLGFRFDAGGHIIALKQLDEAGLVAAIVRETFQKTLKLWDAATGIPYDTELPLPADSTSLIYGQGELFITAGQDIHVFTLNNGYRPGASQPELAMRYVLRHSEEIVATVISDDGQTLATSTLDGVLQIWDRNSTKKQNEPLKLGSPAYTMDISRNGAWLAIGSQDGSVRAVDINGGLQVADSYRHAASVMAISFDEIGNKLISASVDGNIRVTETGLHLASGYPEWLPEFAEAIVSGNPQSAGAGKETGDRHWRRWRQAIEKQSQEHAL